jgi:hypothetical protein
MKSGAWVSVLEVALKGLLVDSRKVVAVPRRLCLQKEQVYHRAQWGA